MNEVHFSCQGESHKAINKVCQDYSLVSNTNELTIAIVCDGHGGARYFRSDVGARVAAEVTMSLVTQFVKDIDASIFVDQPYTRVEAVTTEITNQDFEKQKSIEKAFRQLFSSILYNWDEAIHRHAEENPITDVERKTVDAKYIEAFERDESIEKNYGSTLMCYVQIPKYWFAFHLGDGKCLSFDENKIGYEPIPWDDRCFLNRTTSISDTDAINEFRYCYQGDGHFPVAVVLGSDGIDDSFGETENMTNFYIQLLKAMAVSIDDAQKSLEESLPELSRIGSKDDMSVVCVCNYMRLSNLVKPLIKWQRDNVYSKIEEINQRIESLQGKKVSLEKANRSEREEIDYTYTNKELQRAFDTKKDLIVKYNKFDTELRGEAAEPYFDEIGTGEIVDHSSPTKEQPSINYSDQSKLIQEQPVEDKSKAEDFKEGQE